MNRVSNSIIGKIDYIENVGGVLRQILSTTKNIDFNKTAILDLGTLSWTYNSNGFFISAYALRTAGGKLPSASTQLVNAYCSQFATAIFTQVYNNQKDLSFGVNDVGSIIIRVNNFVPDSDLFKKTMKNVLLAFEKAS